MDKKLFGKISDRDIFLYTLKDSDLEMTVMERGCAITSLKYRGTDVIGGFDTLNDYLADTSHQGAVIGRVANRVGGAKFKMDGVTYSLPKNDGENCLHGGDGFDHKIWNVDAVSDNSITFTYTSRDGEEGFPSELSVKVNYTLSDNALHISYEAIPEGKTPIALTNHSYFNLCGFGGTIEDHVAKFYSENYTEVDSALIPNGNRPSVIGTLFDFLTPHRIGERVGADFIGYDHNLILSPKFKRCFLGKELGLAGEISGGDIKMSIFTDQPGIQFYIGNFLGNGPDFKGGVKQVFHGAFCVETQTEPDCINHGDGFYSLGDVYTHNTVYLFERR